MLIPHQTLANSRHLKELGGKGMLHPFVRSLNRKVVKSRTSENAPAKSPSLLPYEMQAELPGSIDSRCVAAAHVVWI